MKITIIGAGNMGGATAKGLVKNPAIMTGDITVTTAHLESLWPYAELGMCTTTDNRKAVENADMIIWAVKPWIAPVVIDEVRDLLKLDHQLMVTMMPGIGSEDFALMLKGSSTVEPKTIYVIPNTAIEVGESMTFVAPVSASAEECEMVCALFRPLGPTMKIEYRQLSGCCALASCGIAFALRYIRAASEGGVQLGVKAREAQAIVAQTVKGAAALLQHNGTHAEYEIDRVTTPGGITIKGLNAMEANGFTHAVIEGLLKAKA